MRICVQHKTRNAWRNCKRLIKGTALSTVLLFEFSSCDKLVEVPPPATSLTSENVYKNDNTAASVLTGIYTEISSSSVSYGASINSLSLIAGLSSDELVLYGGAANANVTLTQYYLNKVNPGNAISPTVSIWASIYKDLYTVNLALERLQASTELTPAVKQQLTGEAKFLRGFFYFYLVNLYGDLPLPLSSDYRLNQNLSRSSQDIVYDQIINDLKDAETLLNNHFVSADAKSSTSERTRPTSWAAEALLARTYLFKKDWVNAEKEATNVINNTALFSLDSLNGVFLKNSMESIWQLQPVNSGWNTEDAKVFILPISGPTSNSTSGGYPVYLSDRVYKAFEADDQRRTKWVNSVTVTTSAMSATYRYAVKYKSASLNAPVTEYLTVLRLAELYLIRAESRAQQGKVSEAEADLNMIRSRAGLSPFDTTDKQLLLTTIYHERQVELFAEWGHRWLDLKRTGKVDDVMSSVAVEKGITWSSNWQWYPVPLFDIIQNPNLIQNAGY